MDPFYIAVHQMGIMPCESAMHELEQLIRERDKVANPVLACVNDSAELAELLAPIDFNDMANWNSFIVLLIPDEGEIRSYRPLRLVENFKSRARSGRKSYDLFCEILELAP
jgi:hypothetical protein